jgi:outer membrane protein with beta-barrel domain
MRYRTILIGLAAVLACVMSSVPASAQEHDGGFFGIGAGFGTADASCDGCRDGDRANSGVLYLRGGAAINPHVLIGGEFNLWGKKEDGVLSSESTIKMYNLMGTLTFYPQTQGFFVNLGAGMAFVSLNTTVSNTTISTDLGKGFGVLLGTGYDIRAGQHVAITPAVQYWYGSPGDLKFAGATFVRDWRQNVIDFTIGLTIF